MRLFVSLLAVVVILGALAMTACNSTDGSGSGGVPKSAATSTSAAPAQTVSGPNDGVERITTAELRDALEKGTAVVVDVRSPDAYKTGHIRGSLNIPEPEIARRKDELPRDKKIVLYCS
ncbi:MAG TPA: rhodanese-like domain-containing protein [Pyrinomonadaceae bacterium]|jgi:3-mercaptopyruvate sulfurtransferase SseA/predicted small secreted protein